MGNFQTNASPRGGRQIGYLVSSLRNRARRGLWAGLGLSLVAAVWTLPGARAQEAIQLDLGYGVEDMVPPEALLGDWLVVMSRNGKPQPVALTINDVTPGKTSGKMTFGSPRRCYIDLEYGGPDRGQHIFYMIRFTNCFDYGPSDFVALSQVPGDDIAVVIEDGTKIKQANAEILAKFDLGVSEAQAAEPVAETSGAETEAESGHSESGHAESGAAESGAAEPGQSDPAADPNHTAPAAAPPLVGLKRVVFAINLAGVVKETAILERQ